MTGTAILLTAVSLPAHPCHVFFDAFAFRQDKVIHAPQLREDPPALPRLLSPLECLLVLGGHGACGRVSVPRHIHRLQLGVILKLWRFLQHLSEDIFDQWEIVRRP